MKTRERRVLTIVLLALLCGIGVIVSVSVGTVPFTFDEVLKALRSQEDSTARLLVYHLRLPRALCGGMVGMCLALSGCILQCVMRNTLASPSTIGVTGGAGFAGYLMLVALPGLGHLLPVGTIIGAFASTMLIYLLAYRKGVSPLRMILSGLAVSALFGALNDVIKTFFADALGNASGFLVGGLNGAGWTELYRILPFAVCGVLLCLLLPAGMNILLLGDETAASLGLRTQNFRFLLIVVSSLLSGAAISVAGLVAFVGLIVPHIARLLVGADHRVLLPASGLLGFGLVVLCDVLGRVILPPGEIPVSILLSVIGAPFFLLLLRTRDSGGEA